MNFRKREKKKKKEIEYYSHEKIHLISDFLICFIGFGLILLAFLSLGEKVPEEYVMGATIAGFFFVFADLTIVNEKLQRVDLGLYFTSLLFGVLSFNILPVVLMMFPKLISLIKTDFFTLVALGIVLFVMGLRALERASVRRNKESEEIQKVIEELKKWKEKYEGVRVFMEECEEKYPGLERKREFKGSKEGITDKGISPTGQPEDNN